VLTHFVPRINPDFRITVQQQKIEINNNVLEMNPFNGSILAINHTFVLVKHCKKEDFHQTNIRYRQHVLD